MKVMMEGINQICFVVELTELDLRMLRRGERLCAVERESQKEVHIKMGDRNAGKKKNRKNSCKTK